MPCDPGLASLHLLTAVSGSVVVSGSGWQEHLEPFGTLVVPADAGPYLVSGLGSGARRQRRPRSCSWRDSRRRASVGLPRGSRA